ETPDRIALVEGGASSDRRRWTYAELRAAAERSARALLRDFEPGETIAIWAPNIPEYVIAQYGAALAGLVVVTVNPAFRPAEARYAFEHAGVVGCLAVPDFRGHRLLSDAQDLAADLPGLRTVVDLEEWDAYVEGVDDAAPLPEVEPDAPAYVLYTSGTTGA